MTMLLPRVAPPVLGCFAVAEMFRLRQYMGTCRYPQIRSANTISFPLGLDQICDVIGH